MIIAHMCLRLATIHGHSKMCSFTVLGWSENLSVSGVIPICLTQCNTSPSHRIYQVVDCCLWNVGPLLFNGCAKLLDIGRNWNTLLYTPIQSIPNMLNGWLVRWVCWPCKNWDVFSFQELLTDPCNMGPCIIMLQHEVMVVDECHNNGPQDLVTLSLCIQNAINFGAFPLHGTVRFGTARYGTVRLSSGRFAFPPQFSTAIEWAGLFTRRYNCAASTAVTSS